jgi:protease secretion system outer membrane protein
MGFFVLDNLMIKIVKKPFFVLKPDKFGKYVVNFESLQMLRNPFLRATFGVLVAVAWSGQACAVVLMADYQKAKNYDPTFQTAIAERQANQASATQARVAYLPQGTLSNQRLQTDVTTRQTITITQPIIDLQNFATLRMAEPRQGFAEATFLVKQQDLAMRLLKASNAIILANENLKLNASKMAALDQQALAAKRKLELGQGTVTDLRDIEVKAAQAKSQQLTFKTALDVAAKQYAAITGERPKVAEFALDSKDRSLKLLPVNDYVDQALQNNPNLMATRFSERVAELEVQRSTGALLPTFSATHSNSKAGGVSNSYSGVLLNMPLQVGSFYARLGVEANYLKAKETTRDVEEKTRVEVEKLREQIETGLEALQIQKEAISAAELSLEANKKSYEGGVRSAVDILNATQTVFQVKSDFVTSLTTQAESILSLLHQVSPESGDTLVVADRFLFAK